MARDYTKRVAKEAVPLLGSGEVVRRAVVANPEGSFLAQLNEGDPLVARAAYRARRTRDEAESAGGVAATIPRRNAYIAVTDRRLVLFGLTKMGKVDSVLAAFRPDELSEFSAEPRGRSNHELRLVFPDGSSVSYLVIQKQDAKALVDALHSLG